MAGNLNGGVLLAVFILAASTASEARQRFDREPEQREVNPGENTVMTCRVYEKDSKSICIWQKDGKPIRLQDGKYEWDGSRQNGDCSLRILNADIKFDDGDWVCQITPSDFQSDDGLSSKPAKLIVRIPPSEPRIYYNGQFLTEERDLEVKAGSLARLRCEAIGGNPAANLKWFIDDEELTGSRQKNETDLGQNNKRWSAISVIEVSFRKEHHNKKLKCVAFHEAFTRRAREQVTSLNILYAPEVRLDRAEGGFEFEADVDEVNIRCVADANPEPDIVWRKAGGESIFRIGSELTFNPVREGDGGSYFCLAKNNVGRSDELSVTFSVLYPPRQVKTRPSRLIDLNVNEKEEFECDADANPPAKYEWLQRLPENNLDGEDGGQIYSRGHGKILQFKNVSYENEGKWVCVASNRIKGKQRKVRSEEITVEVVGKPQILQYKTDRKQEFPRHSDATIKAIFCADPRPRNLIWEWGSLRLIEGQSRGRFKASQITPDKRNDCYQASLSVDNVIASDSRFYYLTVENDRGKTKYGINVRVVDPVPMSAVVGVIAAAMAMVFIVIFCVVYAYKSKKGCFKTKKGGPAFERDTNFRIYPNDHYLAERLPHGPHHTIDGTTSRTLPREQPLGIPTYSLPINKSRSNPAAPSNGLGSKYHQQQKGEPIVAPLTGTVTTKVKKKKPENQPTYPLPPRSQFPLASRGLASSVPGGPRPSGFGTNVRKTPQNVDIPSGSDSSSNNNNNITYVDLQFKEEGHHHHHHHGGHGGHANGGRFANKLRNNSSSLPGGESNSQYYPRVRDRADV